MGEDNGSVRLRSIYVSQPGSEEDGGKGIVGIGMRAEPQSQDFLENGVERRMEEASDPDEKQALEPITLPESTHTLLFTEKTCSLPYFFSLGIIVLSMICLTLVFINNIRDARAGNILNVPVGVSVEVMVAQYASILVALLMEEEIPTGLFLLRGVPYQSFKEKFPDLKYRPFVSCAILRIIMGYFFLLNVLIVLVQADEVISIFYDVLALQFVQQLDDIAFSLCKMDVLGKRLRRACTTEYFGAEFDRQKKEKSNRMKRCSAFLKGVYFINLVIFLAVMITISVEQGNGDFQCNEITVDWGDSIWEDAVVKPSGAEEYQEWTLIFSYFNGVFEKNATTHPSVHRRPVYVERRKFDREDFEVVTPATIQYCDDISAWVLTHPDVFKRVPTENGSVEDGCNWLLRSPETDSFDVTTVDGAWSIWTGVIGTTDVSIECNTCYDDVDCNLNGVCDTNGRCQCNREIDREFLGTHCENKLKNSCKTVRTADTNATFSIDYYQLSPDQPERIFQMYGRPVYSFVNGNLTKDEVIWLVYSGSRWFGLYINLADLNATMADLEAGTVEYHAFWNQAYSTTTFYVSDATKAATPVASDWYEIVEHASESGQYGPLGKLKPVQNESGWGFFSCNGEYVPVPEDRYRDESRPPIKRSLQHAKPLTYKVGSRFP